MKNIMDNVYSNLECVIKMNNFIAFQIIKYIEWAIDDQRTLNANNGLQLCESDNHNCLISLLFFV